ncbi:hypothetical protein J4D99_16895 [Siccationidurans ginsengisoli]|uniref:hypothetical protein n=1 Tax=Hymenobacter TaxID=89966 RepID=UPI001AAC70F8|nr:MULTISPECIES: hypothetical protein [unclassified Hymenobacter]MBO2033077.1 hypothetical protein [Hymenobacter sp. BT559]
MVQFIQQLFQRRRGGAGPNWEPAAEPTPAQAQRHAAWVAERVYRNWLGPYFKAYHLKKGGAAGRRGLRVELLHENGRQGALFFYDSSIGPGNFEHLYQLLGERIVGLGYHRSCHDCRQRRHEQLREHTIKQLFKPNPTDCAESGRCNQRYGLITLDLVVLNGQPLFIRLSTNPVHEACFTPPQSFEALLKTVFDEPVADAAIVARIAEYQKG